MSTMSSDPSNYTGGSDYTTQPSSPGARPSRSSSKKVHNFGKRSNSIRRNPNALVIKSNWLYKQDSTGMKLWKKRWFVLSEMCLYYYRDEKEEGILGSILLPSFHISMLSVDDHINRKYAFKATHPNMRTYYFCTDTAKDMESWMKVMTDAALVHSEPAKRLLKVDQCGPQEVTNHVIQNHQHVLTRPEIQNNERNRAEANRELEPTHTVTAVTMVTTATEEDRKQREAERYGFQKEGAERERPLTKINSIKLQPDQTADAAANIRDGSPQQADTPDGPYRPPQVNGAGGESPGEMMAHPQPHRTPSVQGSITPTTPTNQYPHQEPEVRTLTRTNSMQQLEQWVRTQRVRNQDDDTRSVMSYQTLPRNMHSHRAPSAMPQYVDHSYRTLPRNSMARPDSICSMSPSMYDQALGFPGADKRRSMRDDTMWQLYEWQQRQAFSPSPRPLSSTPYGTLPSPKTMINLSEQQAHGHHSIPPSPSHGSLSMYGGYSPLRSAYNHSSSRSEVASPVYRGDVPVDRRHSRMPHGNKYAYQPDRRSMPAGIPVQTITAQSLQGKTPEELTLLLIKLRRQQADLNSVREHTVAQLMQLSLEGGPNPQSDILSHHLQRNLMYLDGQMSSEDYRDHAYVCRPEEVDIDAKLSRLCEQDKVVRTQESKLQQLHREKHTLETALLSASQEIELSADNPAAVRSVVQQRDVLQNGLLSTCRELSRVITELERSLREYERMEGEVSLAKNSLLEQLEALGSPQTEPPSQQHVHIQKELWRIQDVMEALSVNKAQRQADTQGYYGSTPISNKYKTEEEEDASAPPRPPLPQAYELHQAPCPTPPPPPPPRAPEDRKVAQRNGTHSGPDYRLYKSEPELTTVAEVDETNGEDRSEQSDRDPSNTKGMSYPVGIVPPRTKSPNMPESSSIASYVTLRKGRRPDPRTMRPHSAVDQLCAGSAEKEAGRPRMSVEEQLERIKRHQQGALREKKKGLHILAGSGCNSPQDHNTTHRNTVSRGPSFSKENPFLSTQNRRQRDEVISSDILELEAALREQEVVREQETPAEEIARLKEASHTDQYNVDRELSVPDKVLIPERYVESDPEEGLSPEQEADKQKKVDRIKALIAKNSMQNVLSPPGLVLSPEEEAEEEATAQEQEKLINISYELAAEASRRSKLVAVHSLSSSSPPPEPQPSPSPPPNTQPPQLTDGSHFMCV